MSSTCTEPVAKIDEKGYVYCAEDGADRKLYGHNVRKLRPHELRKLERGETIARY
jgi:hypothetical protein